MPFNYKQANKDLQEFLDWSYNFRVSNGLIKERELSLQERCGMISRAMTAASKKILKSFDDFNNALRLIKYDPCKVSEARAKILTNTIKQS